MQLFVQTKKLIYCPAPAEIACSGLGRIEFMGGGQGRFMLYRNVLELETGVQERLACADLYAPLAAIPEAIDLMVRAMLESGMVQAASLAQRFLM